MAPECQQANAKGLTMVAIGMNKAAEEFLILDDRTREDLASGKYRDQRRGSFGPAVPRPDGAGTSDAVRLHPSSRTSRATAAAPEVAPAAGRAAMDPVAGTARAPV